MIKLETLTGNHDRNNFDCGIPELNRWLQQTAWQHHGRGLSRSFVACVANQEALARFGQLGYKNLELHSILGFFALSAALVVNEELPTALAKRFPRQIPVTRLGRLACSQLFQGQGLGKLMLVDAIERARAAAQVVGSAGLMVDAKNANAVQFYRHFGFVPCDENKLFLKLW
jgi:GNAT superfamily N-acetyltransferase